MGEGRSSLLTLPSPPDKPVRGPSRSRPLGRVLRTLLRPYLRPDRSPSGPSPVLVTGEVSVRTGDVSPGVVVGDENPRDGSGSEDGWGTVSGRYGKRVFLRKDPTRMGETPYSHKDSQSYTDSHEVLHSHICTHPHTPPTYTHPHNLTHRRTYTHT